MGGDDTGVSLQASALCDSGRERAKKGRLTSRMRSHFRFSNVSFKRRIIGIKNPYELLKVCWEAAPLREPQTSTVWYLAGFVVFLLVKRLKSSNIRHSTWYQFDVKPALCRLSNNAGTFFSWTILSFNNSRWFSRECVNFALPQKRFFSSYIIYRKHKARCVANAFGTFPLLSPVIVVQGGRKKTTENKTTEFA